MTTAQQTSRAVERSLQKEQAWATSASSRLKEVRKEQGLDPRTGQPSGKGKRSPSVPVPQQPQAQAQQEPTPEQVAVLSTPVVEAEGPVANARGLYVPEGRLQRVLCDLPEYSDPIRIEIWYRVNNSHVVTKRLTLLDTKMLSAPIRADQERVRTAFSKLTEEEKVGEVGKKLKAEEAQFEEQLREAVRLEELDEYKKICTYVRRVSWNLDLEAPDCNRPESWDRVFGEANDVARWIALPGYVQALRQALPPNF